MRDQTEDRPDSGEFPEQPARRRARRTWVLVGCGVACCALSVVALLGTGGPQGLISRLPGAAGAADFLGLSGGGDGRNTAAGPGSSGPSASSSPGSGASPEASPGGTATPGSDSGSGSDRGPGSDSGSRSDSGSGSGAPPGDRNPSAPTTAPGNGGGNGNNPPPPPSAPETGRPPADPPNDGVPDTPSDPALRPGDSGSAVTAMQQLLYGIGIYHGWRFGTYDADTTAAVQKFQEWSAVAAECREDPRGVYGPATRRALERVAAA
ncbi:peptidoglycan-binding protein [Streptomyces sp. NPDC001262]|uniref:peptidoglycan-binding domain-containing protein n=1 Tax=unclassified Streptomyces TaxID=2593676 RepID=UPI0036880894